MATARFLTARIIGAVGSLLALATTIFFLLRLVPGNQAIVAAGPGASRAQIALERHRLGLDRSIPQQYLAFLGRVARGNFGISSATHTSVSSAIRGVLPSTASLVVLTVIITVTVALPLAALSAFRSSGVRDSLRRVVVIAAAGIPTFWLALMLQHLLAFDVRIFPITGELSEGYEVPRRTGAVVLDALLAGNLPAAWDGFQHLLLPAIVLAVPSIGQAYRLIRAELLRVLARNHVTVMRAAGVPERRLIRRHVLPHAVTPALIIVAAEFGGLFGGAVLVESIFGRSGLGSLMTNAIGQKDVTMVEGGVLVIGVIVILSNLAVDIMQLVRDPRIRAQEGGMR